MFLVRCAKELAKWYRTVLVGMSMVLAIWRSEERGHCSRAPRIGSMMKFSFSIFRSKSMSCADCEKLFHWDSSRQLSSQYSLLQKCRSCLGRFPLRSYLSSKDKWQSSGDPFWPLMDSPGESITVLKNSTQRISRERFRKSVFGKMNILLCTYTFQQSEIYPFSSAGMSRSELTTLNLSQEPRHIAKGNSHVLDQPAAFHWQCGKRLEQISSKSQISAWTTSSVSPLRTSASISAVGVVPL
jgi:hypothetical protein